MCFPVYISAFTTLLHIAINEEQNMTRLQKKEASSQPAAVLKSMPCRTHTKAGSLLIAELGPETLLTSIAYRSQ